MSITGKTTVDHWLDDATVSYIFACVLLEEMDEEMDRKCGNPNCE